MTMAMTGKFIVDIVYGGVSHPQGAKRRTDAVWHDRRGLGVFHHTGP
jgi:hypothetical protein